MFFKLKSLSITNYDSKVMENVKFLEEIENDEEISNNLSDATIDLKKSDGVTHLKLGTAYLVKDDENPIGLVRLVKKNSKEHSLSIDIAIHPQYRNMGYGTILLSELSDYILKNSSLIKKISLDIDGSNRNGAKCAENANFNLEGYVDYPTSHGHLLYAKRK